MKCSMSEIDAGNAAVTAERDRLQHATAAPRIIPANSGRRDPFLRAPPKAPEEPSYVEMLNEGLTEIERAGE